jgi:hypothetical protein
LCHEQQAVEQCANGEDETCRNGKSYDEDEASLNLLIAEAWAQFHWQRLSVSPFWLLGLVSQL